jgi:hypothetical protein
MPFKIQVGPQKVSIHQGRPCWLLNQTDRLGSPATTASLTNCDGDPSLRLRESLGIRRNR